MDSVNAISIRIDDLGSIKERMERGLEKGFQWLAWKQGGEGIDVESAYCIKDRATAEDFCWNPGLQSPFKAARLLPAYQALVRTLKAQASGDQSDAIVRLSLEGIEKIDPLQSKRQVNYESLRKELEGLGLWNKLVSMQLAERLVEEAPRATVYANGTHGVEPLLIAIQLERKDEWYSLRSFSISSIPVPEKEMLGVDLQGLQKRMAEVRWLARNNFEEEERLKAAGIFGDLRILAGDPAGKAVGDKLFFKYIESPFHYVKQVPEEGRSKWESKQVFPVSPKLRFTYTEALNLFFGRAVYKEMLVKGKSKGSGAWFMLHPDLKEPGGNKLLGRLDAYYNVDLERALSILPAFTEGTPNTRKVAAEHLYHGSILEFTPREGEGRGVVLLTFDPLGKTFSFKNQDGTSLRSAVMVSNTREPPCQPFVALFDQQMKERRPPADQHLAEGLDFGVNGTISRQPGLKR
jgi:hypothetical protein